MWEILEDVYKRQVNDYRLVVIGGVLITAMALAGEILFGWMQRSLEYKYTGRH